jgi:hypothetical protein
MPYRMSSARKAFDAEVAQLVTDLRSAHQGKALNATMRTHIVCSCVLLGMARLEVYVADLITDWLNEVNGSGVVSSRLPQRLRAFYLHDSGVVNAFKSLLVSEDEGSFLTSVGGSLSSASYHLAIDTSPAPKLYPKRLIEDKKYPSPKNVHRLFYRVGFESIFNELNRSAKADMKLILQSFNDIRTAVAHEGVPPGASYKDIIRHLRDVQRFVYHLDRVMYKHVSVHSGSATWKV